MPGQETSPLSSSTVLEQSSPSEGTMLPIAHIDIPMPTIQDVIDYAASHEFFSEKIGLFKWDYVDGKLEKISSEYEKFESSDFSFSPNGKYCVACGNMDFDGRRNDVLFFSDRLHVATVSVKDALSAKVKDSGYFSLEYFGSGEIKKRTSVYNPKGVKIATLKDWWLFFDVSENGETLVMYPDGSDKIFESSITIFNTRTHRQISSFDTIPGKVSFDFSSNETTVQKNGLCARYSVNGDVTASSGNMEAMKLVLCGGQVETVMGYVKKERAISEAVAAMLDKHLDTFTDKSVSALAYRAKGELAEKTGNIIAAIAFYEKAVEINPKIGIKQHLTKLQQEQGHMDT
jgi:hypothetical protein